MGDTSQVKRNQLVGSPNKLEIFVPIKPVNSLNARENPFTTHRRARREKDILAASLLEILSERRATITASPQLPKTVHFLVRGRRRFDEGDNLSATCKHLRDGLVELNVLHSDAPDSGHKFVYAQRPGPPFGVKVTITRRDGRAK